MASFDPFHLRDSFHQQFPESTGVSFLSTRSCRNRSADAILEFDPFARTTTIDTSNQQFEGIFDDTPFQEPRIPLENVSVEDQNQDKLNKLEVASFQSITLASSSTPQMSSEESRGRILARTSTRSIMTKDWKEAFYCFQKNILFVFRSYTDMETFLNLGTSKHRELERKALVKVALCIGHETTCSVIGLKAYRPSGEELHHFTIEQHRDYGTTTIAKFGSETLDPLARLRSCVVAAANKARRVLRKDQINRISANSHSIRT